MVRFSLALLLVVSCPCLVPAADLAKIDRTIRKEPKYQYKPKYLLLVFGPKADRRVWVVLDAVADPADPYKKILGCLYVDRKGDGDLTGKSNRIEVKQSKQIPLDFESVAIESTDGKTEYELVIGAVPCLDPRTDATNREGKFVKIEPNVLVKDVTNKRWFGVRSIEEGAKVYGESPKEAPVAHIGGPLRMGFEVANGFTRKAAGEYELAVGVVTPGHGKGIVTFLCHWDDAIPKDVYPKAVLEFPNKVAGGPAIRVETILKQKC